MEMEVGNLQTTLKQYGEEFAKVKNQEVTIRQLREKLKTYEDTAESSVEERVAERESQLRLMAEERERTMDEASAAIQSKLQASETEVSRLEANLSAARDELYRLRSRVEDKTEASSAQIDLLQTDAERAMGRAEAAERQLVALTAELESLRNAAPTVPEREGSEEALLSSLRTQLSAKDAQLSAQISELTRARSEVESERLAAARHREDLEERVGDLESKLKEANDKVKEMADYDEIKAQLQTLMTIEFGDVDREHKSLEVLLLEKNKNLQSELTTLKLSHQKTAGDDCPEEGPPGPLQPLVDSFGALIGAEMAASFTPQPDLERLRHALFGFHPNNSPIPPDSQTFLRQLQELSSEDDDLQPPPLSPPETVRSAKAEEPVEAALVRLSLPDIEVQVKNGMGRYQAEQLLQETLQTIIAENMVKLGDAALNTGQVAGHCRTLLSMYNLGQRLFAKCILNQSQGSLSELLSKPRPWQRLTEKGREAFRKMFAWVSDERAITLLRSLSPRRAYIGLTSGATGHSLSNLLTTPEERASSVERSSSSSNRWRHDDIPKEMVQEIYQRELAKLKEQENSISMQVKFKSEPSSSPNGLSPQPLLTPKTELNGSLSLMNLFPERQHRQRGLLRSVLPQITQEQFEQYSQLNTEELVRQVKDFLSQHSISQRLFGEHVLGLSQGSVSDLLARPKPWHMLTQKGREPFIRMQLFLSDPTAVDQLRSRKSQRGASTTLDHRHSASPSVSILPKQDVAALLDSISRATQQASPARPILPRPISTASSDGLDSSSSSNTDLDTTGISENVRRLLHENSIGQKLFGEAVLGVSQGTVSELLSKPKPWGSLSLRGREPYIRMHSWLQDPLRIEKLQQYMMLVKTGRGLKRGSELSEVLSSLFSAQPAVKKARSLITEQQKEALKFAYEHEPYPSSKTVEFLAAELALSVPTVTNWFHNHRMRVKNSTASDLSAAQSLASPVSSPSLDLHDSFSIDDSATSTPRTTNTWKKGLMDLISLLGDDDSHPILQDA